MGNVVVIGAQWGDEGKGKIVDWLSSRADVVVRFQGGHNAGHTLVIDGVTYKLSLLPSGIVRPGKLSVIGNGVVVDPWALDGEIERLRGQGLAIGPENLIVADNACLILPVHRSIDRAREAALGTGAIGTTGRGIGPAYEDKVARRAIRLCDLADPDLLARRLEQLLAHHNALLRGFGEGEMVPHVLEAELAAIAPRLLPYAAVVWKRLAAARADDRRILFEGAQGIMLDIDHGTYPFVTSSNVGPGQAVTGAGVGPGALDYVLGITKAYMTRVGSGPFPSEQDNETGRLLGERGREFGTVTGRKRRCGWFDAVLTRQAMTVAGVDGIALTKLDVLDGLDSLQIAVGYRIDGVDYDHLPAAPALQARAEAIYETVPGWRENTRGARTLSALPKAARAYIARIEELIDTPVALLSTSPEREDTICTHDPFTSPPA